MATDDREMKEQFMERWEKELKIIDQKVSERLNQTFLVANI